MSNKDSYNNELLIPKYRESISQNVKELIKVLRTRDELTQTELAQRVQINRSLICQYESGDRHPSMESIIKLALFAGKSVDSIIGLTEPKYKLDKGEEKVINTLRKMPKGFELTVKKQRSGNLGTEDALISVKQEVLL